MIIALARAVRDLLLDVPAVEPIQFTRLVNTYHAYGVPATPAKVLPATSPMLRLQVRITIVGRIQQVQGTIRTVDRPSRLYHYSFASGDLSRGRDFETVRDWTVPKEGRTVGRDPRLPDDVVKLPLQRRSRRFVPFPMALLLSRGRQKAHPRGLVRDVLFLFLFLFIFFFFTIDCRGI